MKIMTAIRCLALAAPLLLPSLSVAQSSAAVTSLCKIEEIATLINRVHVRCQFSPGGGPLFFASPTSSSAEAMRLVTIASTALVSGRNLLVVWEPFDEAAASYGCATHDCRRPVEIRLVK